MDMQLLRDLFDACAQAAAILGRGREDGGFLAEVSEARARLAPMQVGHLGQLQEWIEDWDALADMTHRYVSHLYGLHPGSQITTRGTPELRRAARRTLELRGDAGTGWSLAWKINLWARLEDGDRAYELLTDLLTPQRIRPSRSTATSVRLPGSPKYCCRATQARFICCPLFRPAGRTAACGACAPAAGRRSICPGATAGCGRQSCLPPGEARSGFVRRIR